MVQSDTNPSRLTRWLSLVSAGEQKAAGDVDGLSRDVLNDTLNDEQALEACAELGVTPQALDARIKELQARDIDKTAVKKKAALEKKMAALETRQAKVKQAYQDAEADNRLQNAAIQLERAELNRQLSLVRTAENRLRRTAGNSIKRQVDEAARRCSKISGRVGYLKGMLSDPDLKQHARLPDGSDWVATIGMERRKWEKHLARNEKFPTGEARRAQGHLDALDKQEKEMSVELKNLEKELLSASRDVATADSELLTA